MVDNSGISSYTLANGTTRYRVRLMTELKAYKWEGFATITEARAWRDDRKQDVRYGRLFPHERLAVEPAGQTVAEVIDQYLIEAQVKKNYRGECTYAAFWKAQHGPIRLEAVMAEQIAAARRVLIQAGFRRRPLAPATVNRYVSWYHHVLNQQVERGVLLRNPCRPFIRSTKKGGQKLTKPAAPEHVWTDAELERVAQELGFEILLPLFAILTGLRQEEQFQLRKEQLNLEKGIGYLGDTKANEAQMFSLNTDARMIAERFIAHSPGSPWLFPDPTDPRQPLHAKSWYNNRFKPACRRAEIELNRRTGKTWHTLRHSFADRLVDLNVNLQDVQQAGRWSSWQAMKRYLKKRRDRVSAGVERLKSPLPLERFLYGNGTVQPFRYKANPMQTVVRLSK